MLTEQSLNGNKHIHCLATPTDTNGQTSTSEIIDNIVEFQSAFIHRLVKLVTFGKVVTPWLPFRRPELMVTPGPVRALTVACLSTLLRVNTSSGCFGSSALD